MGIALRWGLPWMKDVTAICLPATAIPLPATAMGATDSSCFAGARTPATRVGADGCASCPVRPRTVALGSMGPAAAAATMRHALDFVLSKSAVTSLIRACGGCGTRCGVQARAPRCRPRRARAEHGILAVAGLRAGMTGGPSLDGKYDRCRGYSVTDNSPVVRSFIPARFNINETNRVPLQPADERQV